MSEEAKTTEPKAGAEKIPNLNQFEKGLVNQRLQQLSAIQQEMQKVRMNVEDMVSISLVRQGFDQTEWILNPVSMEFSRMSQQMQGLQNVVKKIATEKKDAPKV